MSRTQLDTHAAEDLTLYLENDSTINTLHLVVVVNMLRKLKRLTYNRDKAVKAFQHVADAAAQRYTRELKSTRLHGSYGIFNPATRQAVAVYLRDKFEAKGARGEWSHLQGKV